MKKNMIVLSSILGTIFLIILILFIFDKLNTFDNSIYKFISTFINDKNTYIFKIITSFGSAKVLVPLSIIILIMTIIKKKYLSYGLMLVITLLSSTIIVNSLKLTFARTRPDILRLVTESTYSFPSSHSFVSICFFGFLIFIIGNIINNKYKYIIQYLLGLLILLIGISRIYLGIHYVSDVLAGFCLGLIWLIICMYYTKRVSQ